MREIASEISDGSVTMTKLSQITDGISGGICSQLSDGSQIPSEISDGSQIPSEISDGLFYLQWVLIPSQIPSEMLIFFFIVSFFF